MGHNLEAKAKYVEYLSSPEWRELRAKAYLRAENQCELCGAKADAVHHIRYPKGQEKDELYNLLVVCRRCHEKLHAIRPQLTDEEAYYSASGEFSETVLCPVCHSENAHLSKIAINKGGDIFIVDTDGKRTVKGLPTGRGVSVWVHFDGECGHSWHERWQFHKGATYHDEVADIEIDVSEELKTLWRD